MGSISSWRVVAPRIRTGAFGTSSVERVCARTYGLITSTPQVLPLRFGITTALQINPFLKNCERWVYLAFLKWCAIPKWVPLRWYHFLLVSSVPFVPLFTIYIFWFGHHQIWVSSALKRTNSPLQPEQYLRQLNISHMNNTHWYSLLMHTSM